MKRLKNSLFFIMVVLCMTLNGFAQESGKTVVIFSGRKEPLIKPVIDLFEKQTGIKVVLKTGKSAVLSQQILQEMPNPSADVFIAKESGSLEFLRLNSGFDVYTSPQIEEIPASLRSRDGTWIGVSGRSRAIMFNKSLIHERDVPSKLEDLFDPKYKGKIAVVNSGNESFIAWVSALRLHLGDEAAKSILERLQGNDIALLSKSHTDIRKAVGRGEYPLGLINHYYYHLQKREIDETLRNVGIIYLDQQEGGRGELVNVSGLGVVKNAPNVDNAKRFVDFVVSPEAQKLFAEVNFEYPLVPGVATHPEVLASLNCDKPDVLGCIHMMPVTLDQLGTEVKKTNDLLDEVDWN